MRYAPLCAQAFLEALLEKSPSAFGRRGGAKSSISTNDDPYGRWVWPKDDGRRSVPATSFSVGAFRTIRSPGIEFVADVMKVFNIQPLGA